jgi:signal transduction histidine kinase
MREIPIDRRRLEVRSIVLADSVRIEVTDSGPGFATSDIESVFAPFHTTKRDGLGIGLTISRSIAEQHGGTIWAESPPDGGARVVFVLPLMESHDGSCREPADCICR